MNVVNISEKKFQTLERYNPNTHFINTEAELFLFPVNNRNEYKIFKKFFITNRTNFSNKMFTINTLNDYKEYININELVIPSELVAISKQIHGHLVEFIEGDNLSKIINNSRIDLSTKIDLLKQVGMVLEKMKSARQQKILTDFYIGDMHEDNIIINRFNQIRIIDMDSCKIAGNKTSPSKYLRQISKKGIINNKYQVDIENPHLIIPNENTDNYCYNIMILNTLFQDDISRLNLDEFNNYLDYLDTIGINRYLISNFSNLYSTKENKNLYYLLDDLKKKGYRAHKNIYKIKTK